MIKRDNSNNYSKTLAVVWGLFILIYFIGALITNNWTWPLGE